LTVTPTSGLLLFDLEFNGVSYGSVSCRFSLEIWPLIWYASVRSFCCSKLLRVLISSFAFPKILAGSQIIVVFKVTLTSIQNAICLSFISFTESAGLQPLLINEPRGCDPDWLFRNLCPLLALFTKIQSANCLTLFS